MDSVDLMGHESIFCYLAESHSDGGGIAMIGYRPKLTIGLIGCAALLARLPKDCAMHMVVLRFFAHRSAVPPHALLRPVGWH